MFSNSNIIKFICGIALFLVSLLVSHPLYIAIWTVVLIVLLCDLVSEFKLLADISIIKKLDWYGAVATGYVITEFCYALYKHFM